MLHFSIWDPFRTFGFFPTSNMIYLRISLHHFLAATLFIFANYFFAMWIVLLSCSKAKQQESVAHRHQHTATLLLLCYMFEFICLRFICFSSHFTPPSVPSAFFCDPLTLLSRDPLHPSFATPPPRPISTFQSLQSPQSLSLVSNSPSPHSPANSSCANLFFCDRRPLMS